VITNLSDTLIVSLNRFQFDREAKRRVKILKKVGIPLAVKLEAEGQEVAYDLFAMVLHSGTSPDHGHYFTYAQEEVGGVADGMGTWLLFNDGIVSTTTDTKIGDSLETFPTDTPYVLFFRRSGAVSNLAPAEFNLQTGKEIEMTPPLKGDETSEAATIAPTPQALRKMVSRAEEDATARRADMLIHEEIRALVLRDNTTYLKELTTQRRAGPVQNSKSSLSSKRPPHGDDDHNGAGGMLGGFGANRSIF